MNIKLSNLWHLSFLEKEKKKSKTHGYDEFKENKLTLSKKKRERKGK